MNVSYQAQLANSTLLTFKEYVRKINPRLELGSTDDYKIGAGFIKVPVFSPNLTNDEIMRIQNFPATLEFSADANDEPRPNFVISLTTEKIYKRRRWCSCISGSCFSMFLLPLLVVLFLFALGYMNTTPEWRQFMTQ